MELAILAQRTWRICAVAGSSGLDVVTEYIEERMKFGDNSVLQITSALQKIASLGPESLGTRKFHAIEKRDGLYQITVARHRVSCFFGKEDKLIVCAATNFKKRQKVDKAYKNRSLDVKKKYMKAVKDKDISYGEN